jgi:16S rRNA (guanine1207-N2)-methyltransferase
MLDAYGALLTEQQRLLLRRYYQDDLSLGEIAAQMRVSRQAVHDGLRRAVAAMERYEAALGLAGAPGGRRRGAGGRAIPTRAPAAKANPAAAPVPAARATAVAARVIPTKTNPAAAASTAAPSTAAPTAASATPQGPEHYFTGTPRARPRVRSLRAVLRGRAWTFQTSSGVFARGALDAGTRLLIETMRVGRFDRVLDMGCGYGPVGLVAGSLAPRGSVWMTDVNQRAVALARANAATNGIANAFALAADAAAPLRDGSLDLVLTNPPIRAGRAVVARFIDDAWRVLRPGGRFYLVARTAQGARTLGRLIAGRFGEARQVAAAQGYRVFEARRGG